MLSFTTGGTESVYGNTGVNGDIEVVLWPMHVSFTHIIHDVSL